MKFNFRAAIFVLSACLFLTACGLGGEGEETGESDVVLEETIGASEPNPTEIDQAGTLADPTPAELGSAPVVFTILPGDATARFEIDEDLLSSRTGWGAPSRFTVAGTTDQVKGQLILDPADPQAAQLGEIRIHARTIETENFFRNLAIHSQILNTEEFEFISFVAQKIDGLPAGVQVGDRVAFTIEGALTIRDVTLTETFEVKAALVSESEIEGSASTVIDRNQYGLAVPFAPNVSNVEEEVELYIDFIARTP